jgi:hypothetical protein
MLHELSLAVALINSDIAVDGLRPVQVAQGTTGSSGHASKHRPGGASKHLASKAKSKKCKKCRGGTTTPPK